MFHEPSAVMSESGDIVSRNSGWPGAGAERSTLRESLDGYQGVDALVDAIRAGSRDGSLHQSGIVEIVSGATLLQHYDAHWKHYASMSGVPGYTVLVLKPERGDVAAAMRADRLIVRQALIEEAERSRIGRSLHDLVLQDLAWIRGKYVSDARADVDQQECTRTIDALIERVRTLSFELSPAALTDLGIVAALHWLGDHIEDHYGADVSVIDDEQEPQLSHAEKVIAFRCIRELAINAAKHAAGAEIIVSCLSTPTEAIIRVRDYGPGFDTSRLPAVNDENAGFGLISVEQQLHGIGAIFDLVSEIGAGTRVTIRVPLRTAKEGVDD
jgi:signal transduction histidine kinase